VKSGKYQDRAFLLPTHYFAFITMLILEHKPHHIRRKIAIVVTCSMAFVMLVILLIMYIGPVKEEKEPKNGEVAPSKIDNFYKTIKATGQSLFGGK
jgi:NADH:ubiquinone oxidoreductase subunit 6 (subunit J)